jgi:type IV secretion system protein TrbL
MNIHRLFFVAVAFGLLLLLPEIAHAQAVTTQGVDQVLTGLRTASNAWTGPLQTIALATFGGLCVIDLVYVVGIRQVLAGGFELGGFAHALIQEVIYLGMFAWLVTFYATGAPLVIKGFQTAAGQVGGVASSPNDILNSGIDISWAIVKQASIWHPGDAVGDIICGLVVLGCFCWIVISMVHIIAESFFVGTAGVIVLMFGGLHLTSDIPMTLVRTCIAIGLKLFAMQLIAAVGTHLVQQWVAAAAAAAPTWQGIAVQIGECVVLAAITISVPGMFERFAGGGAPIGGAGAMLGAAGAMAAAGSLIGKGIVKALAQVGGMAAAGVQAGRLASTQLATRAASGTGPTSAAGRAAAMVGSTAKNMASAKLSDIGRGLSGTRSNLGSAPWRQAAALGEQRRLLNEQSNKPTTTAGTTTP